MVRCKAIVAFWLVFVRREVILWACLVKNVALPFINVLSAAMLVVVVKAAPSKASIIVVILASIA